MTEYSIGPGVVQAMNDNGDEARSDERYLILDAGKKISLTLGRDAQYWYYEEDNRVNRLPFLSESQPEGTITWDAWTNMDPQLYDWTCSACSLDWILRSTSLNPNSDRESVVYEIGYSNNINPQYGLMDASGSALQAVLESYGQESSQSWLDFDTVYDLAQGTTGLMSGAAWYHWVALRGVQGSNLWIANSAPGYKGVYDVLSPYDFQRLGSFSVVWLV